MTSASRAAGRLPTVSGVASAAITSTQLAGDTGGLAAHRAPRPASACNARIPLYQGGLPAAPHPPGAGARGPGARAGRRAPSARSSPTPARPSPTYQAAQKRSRPTRSRCKANELALEGARAEHSVGTRTVLDVLNAEQELLNSQVALVTARRDAYVAGFQLLNAMGQAEADDLGLDGGPLYDPLGNYRRVAGNWNDWAERPAPRCRSRPARSRRKRRRHAAGALPPGRDSAAAIAIAALCSRPAANPRWKTSSRRSRR